MIFHRTPKQRQRITLGMMGARQVAHTDVYLGIVGTRAVFLGLTNLCNRWCTAFGLLLFWGFGCYYMHVVQYITASLCKNGFSTYILHPHSPPLQL